MNQRSQNIIFNICITLNCLLVFLLVFGTGMKLPSVLQVAGRMHPLLLHFPIVLLIIAFIWELFIPKKEHVILKETGDWLLLSAAFTAALTALMGLFLSKEEGYDEDAIALHKWTGAAIALISIIWFAYRKIIRKKKITNLLIGSLGMIAVILAGHKGADITHGENFLLAPVTLSIKKPNVFFEDAVAYTHLIKPILQEKCMGCHNNKKAKGELVMETEALLLKGGKNGKLWDSTAENFGLMMKRIHLPDEQKEHMPPKGKPQLSNEEVKALFYWIKDGASFTKKLSELPETDTLRMVSAGFFKTIETDNYDFAPADETAIKKLNTDYRVVQPVALNSPALSVQFFGASFFKGEQVKELEKVKNNIVSLNLNKMPVKNEDLKRITAFRNLRKLNLSFTQITGDGLSELKVLKELRHLSLAGTVIKAADIELLKGMDKLTAVYLWNTGITENEIALLRKKFPETTIQTGFRGDTVIAQLNMPVIEGEEQIFTGEARIKVKNFIKGAVMRYTVDGSNPDSLQSPVYKDDIVMDKSGVLKVKAFLPGWISSDIAERNFYKTGFKPDSVKLATPPNPTYAADGGKTLSDGEKGELNFRTKWLGYKDNDMMAYLYFNEPVQLSNVSISTIIDIGSYIMPAQQIEVWGGTSFSSLQLLKKINPQQPSMQVPPYMKGFDCDFPKREIKILKIIAKPVNKLPSWHPGKGQRGWVFVDEVFLN